MGRAFRAGTAAAAKQPVAVLPLGAGHAEEFVEDVVDGNDAQVLGQHHHDVGDAVENGGDLLAAQFGFLVGVLQFFHLLAQLLVEI